GDMRGQPGDPEETTFEVTPLKIGERLYLCTPHQSVLALDATTGKEIWRYDPQIRDQLALQHLTCRGLSYYDAQRVAPPQNTETGVESQDAAQPAGSRTTDEPAPVEGGTASTASAGRAHAEPNGALARVHLTFPGEEHRNTSVKVRQND